MKGERIRVREAIGKSGSDGGSITESVARAGTVTLTDSDGVTTVVEAVSNADGSTMCQIYVRI